MKRNQQAFEKAEREYQKYRQLTVDELSQTERDYIDSIKTMQKQMISPLHRQGDENGWK